jgi:hypothetical protein
MRGCLVLCTGLEARTSISEAPAFLLSAGRRRSMIQVRRMYVKHIKMRCLAGGYLYGRRYMCCTAARVCLLRTFAFLGSLSAFGSRHRFSESPTLLEPRNSKASIPSCARAPLLTLLSVLLSPLCFCRSPSASRHLKHIKWHISMERKFRSAALSGSSLACCQSTAVMILSRALPPSHVPMSLSHVHAIQQFDSISVRNPRHQSADLHP